MSRREPPEDVQFRRMSERDADAGLRLTQAVHLPHRASDWQFLQRLGTGWVAETADAVIGTAMCWSHGTEFASIGMIIVAPEWQGKGIGGHLMRKVMAELGKRCILLNATSCGIHINKRFGFQPVRQVHQHQGIVFQPRLVPLQPGERIRPIIARDATRLAALANRACGMPRGTVLSALLESADAVVLDCYDELIGCALIRRFGLGYVIGPVIAPDVERAKALIAHWTGTYAGALVRIDIPANCGLSGWLVEQGLLLVNTVTSMARGEPPLHDQTLRQFALTSQALG